MAKCFFNLHGYIFEQGLGDIRRAYDATIAALEGQRERAHADRLEFQRAFAAGEVGSTEYDDAGNRLYDYEELHDLLIEQAASSIPVARQAYVVILHHYWEKCCGSWMQTGQKRYNHKDAYAWLTAHDLAPDRDALETLREATNVIKHNSAALYKRRPDLFSFPDGTPVAHPDFLAALSLTSDDIDYVFAAVKNSGIAFDRTFEPSVVLQLPARRS
jgi:hypothetical protein